MIKNNHKQSLLFTNTQSKGFAPIILLVLIIPIIVGAGAYFYFSYSHKVNPLQQEPPVQKQTPTPTVISTDNISTFTSKELKISFQYPLEYGGEKVAVKNAGTTVFVGEQSVEVFQKQANESLKDAVARQILNAPSKQKACSIVEKGTNRIVIQPNGQGVDEVSANAKTCGEKYVEFGGVNYFYSDPTNPNIFVSFNIGQSAIVVGDKPWQETIKFLP